MNWILSAAANGLDLYGQACDVIVLALRLRVARGAWPRVRTVVDPCCGLLKVGLPEPIHLRERIWGLCYSKRGDE